jgi:AcrR family transcriptional regulator
MNDKTSSQPKEEGESTQRSATSAAIANAGLTVADREGLRGVTIRAVAKAVGLSPMALYTYFDTKEHLYDAMFGQVLERAFERVGRSTWQLEIEGGCRQARGLLLAHPEWLPLLTRVNVPASSLPSYEHLLALTAADGMTPLDTLYAISAAVSFTLGAVLVERMMSGPNHTSVPTAQLRRVRDLVAGASPAKWPRVAAASDTFDAWSFDAVFEQGLRALVAGIEQTPRSPRDT